MEQEWRLHGGSVRAVGKFVGYPCEPAGAVIDGCVLFCRFSTGFDLLLQTLKLPAGSEILCSAITIPDMIYLVRHHGLVPVPVDLDVATLEVDMRLMAERCTNVSMVADPAGIFRALY